MRVRAPWRQLEYKRHTLRAARRNAFHNALPHSRGVNCIRDGPLETRGPAQITFRCLN